MRRGRESDIAVGRRQIERDESTRKVSIIRIRAMGGI